MNTKIFPRTPLIMAGIALALSGCGGDQNTPSQAKQAEKSLRMGSASVTTPYTDPLEIIATNAFSASVTTAYIPNQWGGHQARITHHTDGTIRLIYITASNDPVNPIQWNLKKRDPVTGSWSIEATGLTTDDINLLRDPQTDAAYVVAYPNSVPTVYSGPSYTATAIGGTWQNILAKNRHYGAAGIGADGTLCFKTNVDLNSNPPTSNTRTDFTCGNYVSGTGWVWKTQQQKVIGPRYTYDYMFPGGFGTASQLVATAQSDLYKKAAGYPNSGNDYVFNGYRLYSTEVNGISTWNQYELQSAYPGNYDSVHQTYVDASTVTTVPQARMNDSFINSQNIVFSTYFGLPGSTNLNPAQGQYMVVSDASGNILQQIALSPTIQSYGSVRVFEDSQHRMWILWTGQGNKSSNMILYRLVQSGATWSLGTSTSLGSVFNDPNGNFSIDGPPFLALPRGGQTVDNVIYASIAACGKRYTAGQNIQRPYYPDGDNTQNILHFRIHLPD